jgi:hypothetical protein
VGVKAYGLLDMLRLPCRSATGMRHQAVQSEVLAGANQDAAYATYVQAFCLLAHAHDSFHLQKALYLWLCNCCICACTI